MDRGKADEWNGVKLETLAKEYMNVRKEMWTILAERLGGEKWTMVEAKVRSRNRLLGSCNCLQSRNPMAQC